LWTSNARDLVGCQADNLNTSFASISIQSTADRFDGNGVGCALHAGGSLSAATRADGNLLTFEAYSPVYNQPQAEKAWSRLLALYGKALA
jgi:hypothetical protein